MPLRDPRRYHTATLLGDGQVLVAGGLTFSNVTIGGGSCGHGGDFVNLDSAELYNPVLGAWTPTGRLTLPRDSHTGTLLDDGTVLVAGGLGVALAQDGLTSAELYNPTAHAWVPTGSMAQARANHTATRLEDGKVLVAGGLDGFNGKPLKSTELYDPVTKTWSRVGDLTAERSHHTATLLPDGKVLVVGGGAAEVGARTAELYDPATEKWTATGDPASAHFSHTATLVGGRVLVVGGNTEAMTELYDPAAGTWSQSGELATPRSEHTANLLPGGRVLVAGGLSAASTACAFDSTEVRAAADLSVTTTASPESVAIGQEITYLIRVHNAGPDVAKEVISSDFLPPGVELTSASEGCSEQAGHVVVCESGSLASGADAPEKHITVRTTSEADATLANRVTTESATPDVNQADNEATTTTRVDRPSAVIPPPLAGSGSDARSGDRGSDDRGSDEPSSASDSRRARGLRSCLARARAHTRRERRLARRGSRAARVGARRHLRRHGSRLRRRCAARWERSPGRVTGLHARARSKSEIVLTFRAPGTDGAKPPAARAYLVKQSHNPIRGRRAFRRAQTLCGGSCRFDVTDVGTNITLTITDLQPRTTYYYVVAARDNVSRRLGPRSRVVRARTR